MIFLSRGNGANLYMEHDVTTILREDFNYRINKVIQQNWRDRRFSYKYIPRPDHGILLVTVGQMLFYCRNETISVRAGEIIFLPKGSCYEAVVLPEFGETVDYLVNFDSEEIRTDIQPMLILRSADSAYLEAFKLMTDKTLLGDYSEFWIKGRFYLLLDMLLKDHKQRTAPEQERIMSHARDLLLEDSLSISKIASVCGISASGFRATFSRVYGCSPRQYRMENKISKAKYLLQSTELTVYDISDRLGFYDEAYFCKMFRKYVGCTPKQYMQKRML